MPDKNSNVYTVLFATAVCAVLAVLLASAYNGLKPRIESNEELDRKENILVAVGLHHKGDAHSREEIENLYEQRIVEEVLELEWKEVEVDVKRAGRIVKEHRRKVVDARVVDTTGKEKDFQKILKDEAKKKDKTRLRYVPLYRAVDDRGKTMAYCIPIFGYGLWSWLYGFLALEADATTVRGITFYKDGETPGLGGEVNNPAWQQQWVGKRIFDEKGQLVGIIVKKGKVEPSVAFEKLHMVDGLSGATITSRGVTHFVRQDLELYEPYFRRIRSKQHR